MVPYVAMGPHAEALGFIANPRRNDSDKWANRLFFLMYAILACVGAGSVALHTTLRSSSQAADEVPMLLLVMSIITTLAELGCKNGKLSRPWLPLAASAICAVVVTIYFVYQALYGAFLFVYTSAVVIIIIWTWRLAEKRRQDKRGEKLRVELIRPLWIGAIGAYLGCGTIAWVSDWVLCTSVSQFGWLGAMFLHPMWHFGAGTGTWFAIQVLAAARAEIIGVKNPSLGWYAGAPYVRYDAEEKKHN